VNDFDPGGNFSWVPAAGDVGTHTFTITATDTSGDSALTTQTITVMPPPSISISSVSPQGNIMPGAKFSFVVTATGFTNPSYSIGDSFDGSSASTVVLDPSGNFAWTPDVSQDGDHTITIYAYDSLGHSSSASRSVEVGAGPTLSILGLTPGPSVPFGTTTSFTVGAMNFLPSAFSLSDSFSGTSLGNTNINTSGGFSWVPRVSDVGVHVISIKGTVGAYGKSATTTQVITVLGPAMSTAPIISPTLTTLTPAVAVPATQAVSTASAVGDGYVFKNFMGLGEDTTDGTDVLELQKHLSILGIYTGKQTGYFGPMTEAAVKKFQRARHIPATGFVGIATRAELNK